MDIFFTLYQFFFAFCLWPINCNCNCNFWAMRSASRNVGWLHLFNVPPGLFSAKFPRLGTVPLGSSSISSTSAPHYSSDGEPMTRCPLSPRLHSVEAAGKKWIKRTFSQRKWGIINHLVLDKEKEKQRQATTIFPVHFLGAVKPISIAIKYKENDKTKSSNDWGHT